MDNKKLLDNMNEQYNFELESAYIYKAMALWCEINNWDGYAHFYYMQEEEELMHADKFRAYLLEVGYPVKLKAIGEPQSEFKSLQETFEIAYNHEKIVTSRIRKLYKEAREVDDFASESFISWFVTEQVEEEDNFSGYIERLKRINGDISGLYILNNELSQRPSVSNENQE